MKQKPPLMREEAMVIDVALLLVALVGENGAILLIEVPLTLFGWHAPQVPLGLNLPLAGLVGALVLYPVAVCSAWQDRLAGSRSRWAYTLWSAPRHAGLGGCASFHFCSQEPQGVTKASSGATDKVKTILPKRRRSRVHEAANCCGRR